jgi:hypothetical protein
MDNFLIARDSGIVRQHVARTSSTIADFGGLGCAESASREYFQRALKAGKEAVTAAGRRGAGGPESAGRNVGCRAGDQH